MFEILGVHVSRAVFSKRQVYEVAVDFWTNHLVVPVPSSEVWDCAQLFTQDVIRAHVLGKYSEILIACAKSASMLIILGNKDSTKRAPNENYGRKILELHTRGVGHYTEDDVKNSALILTGFDITREYRHRRQPVRQPCRGEALALSAGTEPAAAVRLRLRALPTVRRQEGP